MNISFTRLSESHFPFLLKWLESPHIKKWWDQDILCTADSVQEKYSDYVKGYKQINEVTKPINPYIICADNQPIGYIQLYNAYDFPRSKKIKGLPKSLGAIDIFIGEETFLGKNIGSLAVKKFLEEYAACYSYIFVDPHLANISAIKAYEKAGFHKISEQLDTDEVWMIWKCFKHNDPKKEQEKKRTSNNNDDILQELKSREPIFYQRRF